MADHFWIDETVADLAGLLAPHGIDAATLQAELGALLGAYRSNLRVGASLPPSAVLRAAAATLETSTRAWLTWSCISGA